MFHLTSRRCHSCAMYSAACKCECVRYVYTLTHQAAVSTHKVVSTRCRVHALHRARMSSVCFTCDCRRRLIACASRTWRVLSMQSAIVYDGSMKLCLISQLLCCCVKQRSSSNDRTRAIKSNDVLSKTQSFIWVCFVATETSTYPYASCKVAQSFIMCRRVSNRSLDPSSAEYLGVQSNARRMSFIGSLIYCVHSWRCRRRSRRCCCGRFRSARDNRVLLRSGMLGVSSLHDGKHLRVMHVCCR